jgi:hypothetical protein
MESGANLFKGPTRGPIFAADFHVGVPIPHLFFVTVTIVQQTGSDVLVENVMVVAALFGLIAIHAITNKLKGLPESPEVEAIKS